MTAEEFFNFRKLWIAEDVDWGKLADEEGDDRVDGNNPVQRTEYLKMWGGDDVTLKMSWLDFIHAGRYSMKFRNQGFDTSAFSETKFDENGKSVCRFYNYVTSEDVCYYDAEFVTESRPAYDVAIYATAFRDPAPFNAISDMLGDLFHALVIEDYKGFSQIVSQFGLKLNQKSGAITADCSDRFDVIFDLTVFPAV